MQIATLRMLTVLQNIEDQTNSAIFKVLRYISLEINIMKLILLRHLRSSAR